ncbi:MAG: hypothetical protein Q9162_001636 [Coniocarpon cinnabarinum]
MPLPTPSDCFTSPDDFAPPPRPPPFLKPYQVDLLARRGHLAVTLPSKLLQLHQDLQAASRAFFQLSHQVKKSLFPASQGTELGYYDVEDEKEYVTIRHADQAEQGLESLRNVTSSNFTEIAQATRRLEDATNQVWSHTAAFLHRVLLDLAHPLNIDPTSWEPILDGCLTIPPSREAATPTLLRTFLYEPDRGTAGAHKDNGILTLCVGNERGLQVWCEDPEGSETYGDAQHTTEQIEKNGCARRGRWEDASGPTILIGAALHALSDARLPAGAHRVVANSSGRQSIVFALRPSTRHDLDLGDFGAQGTVPMRLFWQRIIKGRVNVNAQKAIRETQERERRERLGRRQESIEGDYAETDVVAH